MERKAHSDFEWQFANGPDSVVVEIWNEGKKCSQVCGTEGLCVGLVSFFTLHASDKPNSAQAVCPPLC